MTDDIVDTGFDAVLAGEKWEPPAPAELTVAVSEPAPSPQSADLEVTNGLTPAGVEAARLLVGPLPDLKWHDLAKLAREMAMNIRDRGDILKEFNLTGHQYDFLEAYHIFYREVYANACREWHAPLTTQERITVEAAAILEDSLLTIGARMQNKGEGLPGVVEAAKLFAKIAKVDVAEKGATAPGERFSINIDLGGDKKITVETTAAPAIDTQ